MLSRRASLAMSDASTLFEEHIHVSCSARDSLDYDRQTGLRLCDGKRSRGSTICNTRSRGSTIRITRTFEVHEYRDMLYLEHRNSLDLDRNGNVLCGTRGSASWRRRDSSGHEAVDRRVCSGEGVFKRKWRSLKQQVCKACEEEAMLVRTMVNYLKPGKRRRGTL